MPQKSTKPLTTLDNFILNTDERAIDRKEFDDRVKEQERFAEEARRMKEQEEKAREEQEVKQLRRLLVHRPQPILAPRPFEVRVSQNRINNICKTDD